MTDNNHLLYFSTKKVPLFGDPTRICQLSVKNWTVLTSFFSNNKINKINWNSVQWHISWRCSSSTVLRSNWNLEYCCLVLKKPLEQGKNQQQTQPRPHWWKVRSLRTVPSLLSNIWCQVAQDLPTFSARIGIGVKLVKQVRLVKTSKCFQFNFSSAKHLQLEQESYTAKPNLSWQWQEI